MFVGLTGGVTLNANGDREQAYMIRHMQSEDTGDLEVRVNIRMTRSINMRMSLNERLYIASSTSVIDQATTCVHTSLD